MSSSFCHSFICFISLFLLGNCLIYKKCQLAQVLVKNGIPKNDIANWLCLVRHESSFNTAALNKNRNKSTDYGIFQINNGYWCTAGKPGKDCNIDCNKLVDNNIADDIKCAKFIKQRQGFNAWYGWKNNCQGRNLQSYTNGCKF